MREVPGEGVLRGGGAGGVESKRQAFRHEDHSQIEDQRGEPAAEQTHSGHPRVLVDVVLDSDLDGKGVTL